MMEYARSPKLSGGWLSSGLIQTSTHLNKNSSERQKFQQRNKNSPETKRTQGHIHNYLPPTSGEVLLSDDDDVDSSEENKTPSPKPLFESPCKRMRKMTPKRTYGSKYHHRNTNSRERTSLASANCIDKYYSPTKRSDQSVEADSVEGIERDFELASPHSRSSGKAINGSPYSSPARQTSSTPTYAHRIRTQQQHSSTLATLLLEQVNEATTRAQEKYNEDPSMKRGSTTFGCSSVYPSSRGGKLLKALRGPSPPRPSANVRFPSRHERSVPKKQIVIPSRDKMSSKPIFPNEAPESSEPEMIDLVNEEESEESTGNAYVPCMVFEGDSLFKNPVVEIFEDKVILLMSSEQDDKSKPKSFPWNFVKGLWFVDNVEETFQLHSAEGDDKQGRIQSRSFKQALSNCCGTSHGCIRIQSCEIKEASEHIPPSIWMYFDGVSFKKFVETVSELCPVSERVVHVNTSSEVTENFKEAVIAHIKRIDKAITQSTAKKPWPLSKEQLFCEVIPANVRNDKSKRLSGRAATNRRMNCNSSRRLALRLSKSMENNRIVRYPHPWNDAEEIRSFIFAEDKKESSEDWKIADPEDPDQLYQIIKSTGSIGITFGDAARLRDGEFLNDSLIDFWLKYRTNTLLPPKRRETVHVFSSLFSGAIYGRYSATKDGLENAYDTHQKVERWTKNVDVFSCDVLLIPVHHALHWSLAVVLYPGEFAKRLKKRYRAISSECPSSWENESEELDTSQQPCVVLMDSLQSHSLKDVSRSIRYWLMFEWLWRKSEIPGDRGKAVSTALSMYVDKERNADVGTEKEENRDLMASRIPVPSQTNSWDCGIYVLRYADMILQAFRLKRLYPLSESDIKQQWRTIFGGSPEQVFDYNAIRFLRQQMYEVLYKLYTDDGFLKFCSLPRLLVFVSTDMYTERVRIDGDCGELSMPNKPRHLPVVKKSEVFDLT